MTKPAKCLVPSCANPAALLDNGLPRLLCDAHRIEGAAWAKANRL